MTYPITVSPGCSRDGVRRRPRRGPTPAPACARRRRGTRSGCCSGPGPGWPATVVGQRLAAEVRDASRRRCGPRGRARGRGARSAPRLAAAVPARRRVDAPAARRTPPAARRRARWRRATPRRSRRRRRGPASSAGGPGSRRRGSSWLRRLLGPRLFRASGTAPLERARSIAADDLAGLRADDAVGGQSAVGLQAPDGRCRSAGRSARRRPAGRGCSRGCCSTRCTPRTAALGLSPMPGALSEQRVLLVAALAGAGAAAIVTTASRAQRHEHCPGSSPVASERRPATWSLLLPSKRLIETPGRTRGTAWCAHRAAPAVRDATRVRGEPPKGLVRAVPGARRRRPAATAERRSMGAKHLRHRAARGGSPAAAAAPAEPEVAGGARRRPRRRPGGARGPQRGAGPGRDLGRRAAALRSWPGLSAASRVRQARRRRQGGGLRRPALRGREAACGGRAVGRAWRRRGGSERVRRRPRVGAGRTSATASSPAVQVVVRDERARRGRALVAPSARCGRAVAGGLRARPVTGAAALVGAPEPPAGIWATGVVAACVSGARTCVDRSGHRQHRSGDRLHDLSRAERSRSGRPAPGPGRPEHDLGHRTPRPAPRPARPEPRPTTTGAATLHDRGRDLVRLHDRRRHLHDRRRRLLATGAVTAHDRRRHRLHDRRRNLDDRSHRPTARPAPPPTSRPARQPWRPEPSPTARPAPPPSRPRTAAFAVPAPSTCTTRTAPPTARPARQPSRPEPSPTARPAPQPSRPERQHLATGAVNDCTTGAAAACTTGAATY